MKDYIMPPNVIDGNPLSAFCVNSIIDVTNLLTADMFDFYMLKQRKTLFNNFNQFTQSHVLVHFYSDLRLEIFSEDDEEIQIYARKAFPSSTTYVIASVTPTINVVSTVEIDLDASPAGFSVSPGEIYIVSLKTTANQNGRITVNAIYEYKTENYPVAPTIPTVSASTVLDASYLNNIINSLRGIPALPNVNVPFNGVGSPGDSNSSAYMRWRGLRRSRYLHFGFRLIDRSVDADFYINGQLIHEQGTGAVSGVNIVYHATYDFQTNPAGITVPSIGSAYEFKASYTHDNDVSMAGACYILYAYESNYT